MGELTILSFGAIVLQIIFLEGILSLDNAAVLGALVMTLPADRTLPWPGFLLPAGKVLNRFLGKQRTAALRVGLLGAYLGRGLMLVLASFIVRNPWLQIIGAAYLFKLAVENLGSDSKEEESNAEDKPAVKDGLKSFWAVVLTVELMDLAFSLDNVVVVVTITPHLSLVFLGVALGILTMRFAAGLFTRLIEKAPALITAAYVLVFTISLEMLIARLAGVEISEAARLIANLSILILAGIYSRIAWLQRALHSPLSFAAQGFRWLNRVQGYALLPLNWVITHTISLVATLFTVSGD